MEHDAQATQGKPRTACNLGDFSVALDLCECLGDLDELGPNGLEPLPIDRKLPRAPLNIAGM